MAVSQHVHNMSAGYLPLNTAKANSLSSPKPVFLSLSCLRKVAAPSFQPSRHTGLLLFLQHQTHGYLRVFDWLFLFPGMPSSQLAPPHSFSLACNVICAEILPNPVNLSLSAVLAPT